MSTSTKFFMKKYEKKQNQIEIAEQTKLALQSPRGNYPYVSDPSNPDDLPPIPTSTKANSLPPPPSSKHKQILHEDNQGTEQIALLHRDAVKIGNPNVSPNEDEENDSQVDVCPCCFRKIGDELPWNFNSEEIGFLGVGFPQFYGFIQYCIYIVFAIIISSASYNVLSNALLGMACKPEEYFESIDVLSTDVCQLSWTTYFSLANKTDLPILMMMQQVLNLFTIITLIVLLFKARIKFQYLAMKSAKAVCASSYSVFVESIPNQLYGLQGKSIERLIEARVKEMFNVNPLSVNICWNLSELQAIYQEAENKIIELQNQIDSYDDEEFQKQMWSIYKQIRIAKEEKFEKIVDFKKKLRQNVSDEIMINYFTGKVFILFNTIEERDYLLKAIKNHDQQENPLFSGEYYDTISGDTPTLKPKTNFHTEIKMSPAVPPTEIIWENAQYETWFVNRRKFIFWTLSILCMLVCYASVGALIHLQRSLSSNQLGIVLNSIYVQAFAILVSILISVLNAILNRLLNYFNKKTYFTLQTEASTNMAGKLAIAYFLNSAIVQFLITVILPRITQANGAQLAKIAIYRTGGLIYNMQYVFVMNALIIPCMQLIDLGRLTSIVTRWRVLSKIQKARNYLTQHQLNEIFMEPVPNLVDDYAVIISQMYFMAFYSPLIPIGAGTTLVTLCLFFLIHKYKLSKHRSTLHNIDGDLCVEMTEMLEVILPLFCFSNLMFDYLLSEDEQGLSACGLVGLALGLINAIVPMDAFKDFFISKHVSYGKLQTKKPTYKEIQDKMLTDYSRENPITKDYIYQKIADRTKTNSHYEFKNLQNKNNPNLQ